MRIDEFFRDARFALRTLRHAPAFALAAILTLALGIAANTLLFSVVDATVLRPFPFPEPDRLVILFESTGDGLRDPVRPESFATVSEESDVVSLARSTTAWFDVELGDSAYPEKIGGMRADPEYFRVLGVPPALGRYYVADEAQAVVISYRFWQSRFRGDPAAIGSSLRILTNGEPALYTIVGVLSPAVLTLANRPRELWLPFDPPRAAGAGGVGPLDLPDLAYSNVIGRLTPGVTLAAAEAAMRARVESLGLVDDENTVVSARLYPLIDYLTRYDARTMRMLGLGVAFVLLIACAGVANLLLARGAERVKELGIRAAIGAGRARLFRQLLSEALVLGVIGGGAGAFLAWSSVGAVRALVPVDMLRRDLVAVDLRALAFTLGATVLAALLFGWVPAWRASRADVRPVLAGTRGGGRERTRLRSALIVAEIALALVLLTGAGLTIQSFAKLVAPERLGFDITNSLTLRPVVSPALVADAEARSSLLREIETRLGVLPGVQSVGVSDTRPLGTSFNYSSFTDTASGQRRGVMWSAVSADYFDALGIGLVSGRVFGPDDRTGSAPVALVSETTVARYWPGENAVGKVVLVADLETETMVPREIVGVVRDVANSPMAKSEVPDPVLYQPYAQTASSTFVEIVLRVDPQLSAASLIAPARTELAAIDRTLAVIEAPTMAEELAFDMAQPRFIAIVLGTFAALALVLTMIGVGGVVAYLVRARAYEFGVRLALGATRESVIRMVLGYGLKLALVGIVLGTAGSVAVTRLLEAYLFQVEPLDAITMAIAPVVLFAVVLAACWAPSRRILRIDPAAALRHD